MPDLFGLKGLGAFWARGRLSALDRACLSSFVQHGYPVRLFSYEPIANLPEGVTAADAATIVPEAMVSRVRYGGRPDLSHFSDLFRYEMIRKADLVWIDVDLLMIADAPMPQHKDIVVREEQGGLNGAVLYISDKDLMKEVFAAMETKLDKELRWGETGPALIFDVMKRKEATLQIYDHRYFYPVEHYDMWKLLLPEHVEECRRKCEAAATIHLFNNILTSLGYWKEFAPPEGSYLHDRLSEAGLIPLFSGVYPERVMRACIENFRFRQNGKALGIKAVLRQIIPSIGRTYGHYVK